MKTILSIILFFLFYIQFSFGQIEPRLSKTISSRNDVSSNEFRTHLIEEFKYDYNGNLIENIKKYYNENNQVQNWLGHFYEYDSNGNLLKSTFRKYNPNVNLWISIEWVDYTYDSNGCEIERSRTENLGGLFSTYKFIRNDNCQITQETLFTKLTTSDDIRLSSVREISYLPDGISYQEKEYDASFANGELRLQSDNQYDLNSNEQIEKIYSLVNQTFGGYWYESEMIYTYDAQNNITKRSTLFKEDPQEEWVLNSEFVFINVYDDEDRLMKTTRKKYFYPDPGGDPVLDEQYQYESRLDYRCSDLVDRKEQNYTVGTVTYRTDYIYEGEDECFDVENVLLGMSIYPNPSSGLVTIQSPVFQSGNTQVMVFDMSGKLLLEKNEFRREEKSELDLGHLSKGMYVIQLMNQEHFVQSKITIFK